MKAAVVVLGVSIVLVLPAHAQRGGGVSGRMSSPRASSAPRGSARAPRNTAPVRVFRPSMQRAPAPVFVPPRSFTAGPVIHIAAPGFASPGPVRFVPPARRHVLAPRPIVIRPLPVDSRFDPFAFRRFHRFHHFHGVFGSPFCQAFFGFSFHTRHFGIFEREFSCFSGPFFDPFFFGFPAVVGSPVFVPPVGFAPDVLAASRMAGENSLNRFSESAWQSAAGQTNDRDSEAAPTMTLLQLKDGSMYGLVDYWLEDGRLHYLTTYGGENSIPIERIDLDKTVQLNYERGVEFVLRPKPANPQQP